MKRALPCIRIAVALSAIAVAACGCTAANNATSSQASAPGEQPYKTMYGISSEGTSTDLYTEFFGPRPAAVPPTAAQPVQSATTRSVTAQPIAPVQPDAPATRSGQVTAATSPNRPNQAQATTYRVQQPSATQPAPAQIAQQPAPPPPEPDVPTAYGITANGPTTDLYTALFGPRRSDSQ